MIDEARSLPRRSDGATSNSRNRCCRCSTMSPPRHNVRDFPISLTRTWSAASRSKFLQTAPLTIALTDRLVRCHILSAVTQRRVHRSIGIPWRQTVIFMAPEKRKVGWRRGSRQPCVCPPRVSTDRRQRRRRNVLCDKLNADQTGFHRLRLTR